ncbi:unnamed protein product [Fusarium graminearum]|nr:unnamed protein product [Fusarium graminearum]
MDKFVEEMSSVNTILTQGSLDAESSLAIFGGAVEKVEPRLFLGLPGVPGADFIESFADTWMADLHSLHCIGSE